MSVMRAKEAQAAINDLYEFVKNREIELTEIKSFTISVTHNTIVCAGLQEVQMIRSKIESLFRLSA